MDTAQYWFQAGDAASGYQVERSLRFNSPDSAYLNRTPASAGNSQKFTWSAWIKRTKLSSGNPVLFMAGNTLNDYTFCLNFNSTDNLVIRGYTGANAITTAVYRDPSAWYHIVASVDTTQATGTDRIRLYVNNVLAASGSITQNWSYLINTAVAHAIGGQSVSWGFDYFDGYLTEINFIDGQALTPSSFGEINPVTGVWQPKRYTGTYGTNGFYLNFADNSGITSTTLGKDSSGNGNNWTPNNFSVTAGSGNDSLIDTPTPYADGGNGRGNYCTWNPISGSTGVVSNGNLDTSNAGTYRIYGTLGLASGKWYWEHAIASIGSGAVIGISSNPSQAASDANRQGYYSVDGRSYNDSGNSAYGNTYTTGDVIGVAYDADTGKLYFSKNGTWQNSGNPATGANPAVSGLTGTYWPFATIVSCALNSNFGQRPFAYTPPAGFLALNTQNLPEPTIKKPSNYMSVVTGTGANILTAAQGKLLNGAGLIWIKDRANANNHQLLDTVRGGTKVLHTNIPDSETTYIAPSGSSVAWCWSKSAVSGFDIVTFTAQSTASTVAHSLGVAPKFIMFRDLVDGNSYGWRIYHADVGAQKYLKFDTMGAVTDSSLFSTAPTSVAFDPGTHVVTGNGYGQLVAYLWSEVAGFSKFGSCTLNGSTDDVYVTCGFRPSWVMIKQKSSAGHWLIQDAARPGYNVTDRALYANAADGEDLAAGYQIDFTSNGFKNRKAPSGDYIFAAFAESPFKYSLAR
jgi:hypothetical protein